MLKWSASYAAIPSIHSILHCCHGDPQDLCMVFHSDSHSNPHAHSQAAGPIHAALLCVWGCDCSGFSVHWSIC